MDRQKYESQRGRYRVEVVDGKPSIEILAVQTIHFDNVKELIDLFVALASVLNKIYDTEQFK